MPDTQHSLSDARHPLLWNAPLRDPSGYADEARHFLFALDTAGVPVAARAIAWSRKIALLPAERERTLQRLLTRPAAPGSVAIFHILAPLFARDTTARVSIGRTMFETDRLPPGWADACNAMDAIWVPSAFNRATFAFAGVAPEKLRIVPGALDTDAFRPGLPSLQIAGARGYVFLSLFDWTLRKGWDVLLRAYLDAFRPEDDVTLVIKTHSSLGYTTAQIVEAVTAYVVNVLGRDPNRIPDIIFQDGNLPDARMPNLYAAADCYVMPTRGEGWGRPFMEAMGVGLPVIGTNWSGQTAFLTAENALLLDYDVVDVPEVAANETPTYRGHRWAEPRAAHLTELLRFACANRKEARALGAQARADVEARFSYAPVAAIIQQEVEQALCASS